jgi:hypothetical protein
MDDKTITKQRGVRMAMKVAAISIGAGAALMAASASEAAPPAGNDEPLGASQAPKLEQVKVEGWSCWGPTSRGPAAPPPEADDYLALLDEVPE